MGLGTSFCKWLFRRHNPIQTRKKIGTRGSARPKFVKLMFDLLEERLAPATANWNSTTDLLTFTADAAQTVTVTAPSATSLVIVVSGGNSITLAGNASAPNFALTNSNDTLTINTASGKAPVTTFDMYLSNTSLSADTLAFGLVDGAGISTVNISGPAGATDTVDTVTLNSVTLGTGSLSASAATINLAGAVTTTANVSLTAADTATLSDVSIGGSLSVSAGTINDTASGGSVTGDASLTAVNTVTLSSLTVGSSLTVTAGTISSAGTINVDHAVTASGDLTLTADAPAATPTATINLNAEVKATGNVSLDATGTIDIDAEIDSTGGNTSLTAVNPLTNGVFEGPVSFAPSGTGDTITGPAGFDWSSYGFQNGQSITVTGSAISANNASYTIASVSGNVLTLDLSSTVALDTDDPDVNVTVPNNKIVGATVTLDVTGDGTAVPVSVAVQSVDAQTLNATTNNGNMLIENAGPLALGSLNAGTAMIQLDVAGAITDGAASGVVNLTAGNGVDLTTTGSNSAIGTSADPIQTKIGELTATTNDGGVYVANGNGPGMIVNSVVAMEGGDIPIINPNNPHQIVLNTPGGYVAGTDDVSITAQGPILLNSITAPHDITITSTKAFILSAGEGSPTMLAQNVSLVAEGMADFEGAVTYTPNASGDTLTGPIWADYGFQAGQEIVISGASQVSNNAAFMIASISGNTITLTATNSLVGGMDSDVSVGDGMIGLAGGAISLSEVESFSASTKNGDISLAPGIASTAVSVTADTGTDNNVFVDATGPSLTIQSITASGNVTLEEPNGPLLEVGNGNITGQNVSLMSGSTIGPLSTTASAGLSATVTTQGDSIQIDNTSDLSSVTASTDGGNVTISYNTSDLLSFATNTSELKETGSAVVTFTNAAGNIVLGSAMTASSITSTNGAITDPGAWAISGSALTLTAGNGIGVSGTPIITDVTTSLDATTTNQGVYIQQTGAFTVSASTADPTAGNIDVTDTTGNMTLGVISAPGTVTLDAESGAILNGNGSASDINVTADTLTLTATTGIGTSANPLETSVNTLTAAAGAGGGLWLVNNSDLTVTSATAGGGPISISAMGALTLNGNVSAGTTAAVTLTALGALTGTGDITGSTATLSGSQIGQGSGDIQLDATTLNATTTGGGIYVTNSNTAAFTLTASASGPLNDIDISSAGSIVLITVSAPGGTVTLVAGSGHTITNGTLSSATINIVADTLDITGTGGIGTSGTPLQVEVNNEDTVDGGSAGAFLVNAGPTLVTANALEAAGSGTLTFEGSSITIANFGGTTVNVASGRSLVLESTSGPIVFLNPADTIETSGAGTITVTAGTVAGSSAVAVLGNLKTGGGNITVSAPGNISIGQLDAVNGNTKGNVSVTSASGVIVSSNGASPAVIAGNATLSGSAPTAAAAQLNEIQAIAAAAAAAAQAAAEQISANAFISGQAPLIAAQATAQTNLNADNTAVADQETTVFDDQIAVGVLTAASVVANAIQTSLSIAAAVAQAIAAGAQAIPLAGDGGASVPAAVSTIGLRISQLAYGAIQAGLALARYELGNAQTTLALDEANVYTDKQTLALATATVEAFGESYNITNKAAAQEEIIAEADQQISQQAIAAYSQLNVIGTAAAPLSVEVSGTITLNTVSPENFLNVNGDPALGLLQSTGPVTLSSNGAITDGTGGVGPNVLAPGLSVSAVGGIGTATDPIQTRVGTLSASNTTSGDIDIADTAHTVAYPNAALDITGISNAGGGNVFISNVGDAAAGEGLTVTGPISAAGGTAGVTLDSGSPLTVSANITSPGAIDLQAQTESPPVIAGDDLTVEPGVILQSTGSSVSLLAGDDVVVPSGATIEANSTISITGDANDNPNGATVTVAGTLIAASASISVDSNSAGPDTFNITPSQDTPISVTGGKGTDTLNFNAAGLAVTISGNQITAAGMQPVTFTNIAFVHIINAHGGGTLTIDGKAGANTMTLTGTAQGAGTVTLNGGTPISFSGVNSFSYVGQGGGDTITVTPYATTLLPWNVAVTISGGTGGTPASLTYNSVAGLTENTTVTATAADAGSITSIGVGTVQFTDVNLVTANASPGAGDELAVDLRDGLNTNTALLGGTPNIQLQGLFGVEVDTVNYVALSLNGNNVGGPNTFDLDVTGGTLPIPLTVNGGSSDVVNYTASANAAVTVTPSSATISQAGAGPVEYTGIKFINLILNGASSTLTAAGSASTEVFDFTPTALGAGNFTVTDTNPTTFSSPLFTYTGVGNGITVAGGTSLLDELGLTVGLTGTPGNDAVDVEQTAAGKLSYTLYNNFSQSSLFTQPFSVTTITSVGIFAPQGNNIIQVGVADALQTTSPAASLSFDVQGSSANDDQLLVKDEGPGNLDIIRQGINAGTGSVTIGAFNPVTYQNMRSMNITPINPITGGTGSSGDGRVVTIPYDPFQFNNTLPNAALLSSVAQSTNTVEAIDPGPIYNPFATSGPEEWFEFIPSHLSEYQIEILFTTIGTLADGRPGLPDNGNLSLGIYDANGNLITSGTAVTGGVSATFAASPNLAQYAQIYVRVQGTTAASINTYQFANLATGGVLDLSTVPSVFSGPEVTNVQITSNFNYNLFNAMALGENVPTPLVNGLTISFTDPPPRAPGAPILALDPTTAGAPGTYLVQGDNVGIVTISSITVTNAPETVGSPATATVQLTFTTPLPNDHYTLTILDNLLDPAGVSLDGSSNASEPSGAPQFPSGDGHPGSNFAARFAVNSFPVVATGSSSGVEIFDSPSLAGFGTISDALFTGQFIGPANNGYNKLAAYGAVNGTYRFLVDLDGGAGTDTQSIVSNVQVDALPVAGNFANVPGGGDEAGLFTGSTWYLATNPNAPFSLNESIPSNMRGIPFVGDFDGNGHIDLGTYQPSTDLFEFDMASATGQLTGQVNATISLSAQAGPLGLGVNVRPVAADMNGDGITDIGLFVPTPSGSANWYIFMANPSAVVPGTVTAFNHVFQSVSSGGNDLFYTFGVGSAQPLVGIFYAPLGPGDPSSTTTSPLAIANPLPLQTAAQVVSVSADVADTWGQVTGGTVTFALFNSSNKQVGASVTTGQIIDGLAKANLTVPGGTAVGSYSVRATYNGAPTLYTSSGSTPLTIMASTVAATANISEPYSLSNRTLALNVTVTSNGGVVTGGTVSFTLYNSLLQVIGISASASVVNGVAPISFVLPGGTPGGTYTISLNYSGTSGSKNFLASTGGATLKVAPLASTTTAQAATATFSSASQVVTLSATVTSTVAVNGGSVTFTVRNASNVIIGSPVISGTVASGLASAPFTLPAGTPPGTYHITAAYSGSTNFLASSDATKVLTIAKAATVTTASSTSATYNTAAQTVTLQATVTSGAGIVNSGTVTFTIVNSANQVVGTAVVGTVSNGTASVSYKLPAKLAAGTYKIEASYAGNVDLLASSDIVHVLTIS